VNSISDILSFEIPGGNHVKMRLYANATEVANIISNTGCYEKKETEIMFRILSLLGQNISILDIGANAGYYSLCYSAWLPKADIHAFEPMPATFERLKENAELSGGNMRLNPFGLYERDDVLGFYFNSEESGATSIQNIRGIDESKKIMSKVTTMDGYVEKAGIKVGFIKCDVEGAEIFVFKGGLKTLETDKPVVFTEMLRKWSAKFGYHPNDILMLFSNLGYSCYTIGTMCKLYPISSVTENTVDTNFIFLHSNHLELFKHMLEIPLISVILTSYNHAKYIGKAISSVLAQTYENIELIISDNASTDGSREIIRSFNDKRIKTNFFNENIGAVANGEFCISMASGKYCAVLGSDDFWEPSKLARQVEILESDMDIGAVFTHINVVDETGEIIQNPYLYGVFNAPNTTRAQLLNIFFMSGNCLCLPSVLVYRDLYSKFISETKLLNYSVDFYCWLQLIRIKSIYVIQDKLTYYRWHGENISSSKDPKAYILHQNEMELLYDEFFDGLPPDLFYEAFSVDLIKKGELSKEEMMCEQFLLHLRHKDYIHKAIAKRMLFKRRGNADFIRTLNETYGFTREDFYALELKTCVSEVFKDILLSMLFDRTRDYILSPEYTTAVVVVDFGLALSYLNYLHSKKPQCFEKIKCLIFAAKSTDEFTRALNFNKKIPVISLKQAYGFFKVNLLIIASYSNKVFEKEVPFIKTVHLFKSYEALGVRGDSE
jgi:FkbM family methyltransferase